MDIVKEFQGDFSDEIDKYLAADTEYRDAEDKLNDFALENIPADKMEHFERLVGRLTASITHTAVEAGMKIGARIVAGLLK